MKNVNNLKLFGLALCMNATLLTGCDTSDFGAVYLDDGSITGSASYEVVDNNIKIVNFEENDVSCTRLVYVKNYYSASGTNLERYYDIETGTLLKLAPEKEMRQLKKIGVDLEVVDTEPFLPYLLAEDNIKNKYEYQELIDLYHECYEKENNVLNK